jgi:nucleoside-diphosphate-sugar epimerase
MSLVAVTGASGFIGHHLVSAFHSAGLRVRAVVRRGLDSSHFPPEVEQAPVSRIDGSTDWSEILDGVDAVVHLAGIAHRIGAAEHAARDEFLAVNVAGTSRLAEAVAKAGVRRLVFVSSIAVFGSSADRPVSEATPVAPDTAYGRSKLEAELAIQRALARGPGDWVIVRPPLVYGPGNPGNMARLLYLIRSGLPLPLGAVKNRRSFLYVENLTDLLCTVVHAPAASRRCFVVADREMVSTTELLQLIGQVTGKPVRLFPVPMPLLRILAAGSYSMGRLIETLVVDGSLAEETLGWVPSFSLAEGLRRTFGVRGTPLPLSLL